MGVNVRKMENANKPNRKKSKVLFGVIIAVLMITSGFLGAMLGATVGYQEGVVDGYETCLMDVADLLGQVDADFEWTALPTGGYKLSVSLPTEGGLMGGEFTVTADLILEHRDKDGNLIELSRGAGVLTNIGKDWIELQMTTPNATAEAYHLADSNDAGSPSASWTELPNELTYGGLERQLGTYVNVGQGQWNVTKTKTATTTISTQLWGLHWEAHSEKADNNMLASDSTPSQKNMENGDTLTETWQITVS